MILAQKIHMRWALNLSILQKNYWYGLRNNVTKFGQLVTERSFIIYINLTFLIKSI